MPQRAATTHPGCLLPLTGILGVFVGAGIGMALMADADPRQYACPPGLIWGANGAALGGLAGLACGWLLGKLAGRRGGP